MAKHQRRDSSQWEKIVSAQERSGQSARAFCKSESIGEASFYKWRKRLRGGRPRPDGNDTKSAFIEVGNLGASSVSNSESPWHIALELGDGIILNLRRG